MQAHNSKNLVNINNSISSLKSTIANLDKRMADSSANLDKRISDLQSNLRSEMNANYTALNQRISDLIDRLPKLS